MLSIPNIILLLQKIGDGFGNLVEVQNEPLVITSEPEETVDLMHSPWSFQSSTSCTLSGSMNIPSKDIT
jgi:hypothetical protein